MKNTIVFEEVWKTQHEVIIDFDESDDDYLDEVLDSIEYTQDLDEALNKLDRAGINIVSINRDYYEDGDGCEIEDVYETTEDELE